MLQYTWTNFDHNTLQIPTLSKSSVSDSIEKLQLHLMHLSSTQLASKKATSLKCTKTFKHVGLANLLNEAKIVLEVYNKFCNNFEVFSLPK